MMGALGYGLGGLRILGTNLDAKARERKIKGRHLPQRHRAIRSDPDVDFHFILLLWGDDG